MGPFIVDGKRQASPDSNSGHLRAKSFLSLPMLLTLIAEETWVARCVVQARKKVKSFKKNSMLFLEGR